MRTVRSFKNGQGPQKTIKGQYAWKLQHQIFKGQRAHGQGFQCVQGQGVEQVQAQGNQRQEHTLQVEGQGAA